MKTLLDQSWSTVGFIAGRGLGPEYELNAGVRGAGLPASPSCAVSCHFPIFLPTSRGTSPLCQSFSTATTVRRQNNPITGFENSTLSDNAPLERLAHRIVM
jgi:hypothetical protein